MRYQTKPVVIEVEGITFAEFVQYGRDNGANIVHNMPWSFTYHGYPVSHENDQHYLITAKDGTTINFTPQDILVTTDAGAVYACPTESFRSIYAPVTA